MGVVVEQPSFDHVSLPTMPSAYRPFCAWNETTPARVARPKMPSTSTPSLLCSTLTSACVEPKRSVVVFAEHVVGVVGVVGVAGVVGVVGVVAAASFAHVSLPTMPSAYSPLLRWNDLTADSVAGPKMPSALTWSCAWIAFTASPREPKNRTGLTVGVVALGVVVPVPGAAIAGAAATRAPVAGMASATPAPRPDRRASCGRTVRSRLLMCRGACVLK